MFAQHAGFGRNWLLGAVAVALAAASTAVAGPISMGTASGGPPLLDSTEPGFTIKPDNLVTTQFRNQGLDNTVFQNLAVSALASINGTTAFVPAVSNGNGYNLDYGGFVGFQIVRPTSTSALLATTNYVSVEFVGLHADKGFLYAMTPTGGILGSTLADDGIGPHGGRLATLQMDGIGIFAAWSIFDQDQSRETLQSKWGVASISFDSAIPPIDDGGGSQTPEPATLSLAGLGIVGAASAAWKRRRTSSLKV